MIVSMTPFRISFFGGGTDYPTWYKLNGGSVISTTINKYCYITCRYLPPFFNHRHRVVYSRIENVMDASEIQHPSVRAVMKWLNWQKGIEIHHDGDLPARSGLGSSSSFTVGLFNALSALEGRLISNRELAAQAIHIEQEVIRENVGSQDQIAAAFGGFNKIDFKRDGSFDVTPIILPQDKKVALENNLMLFFTGLSRNASDIAKSKIANMENRFEELDRIRRMVDQAADILQNSSDMATDFGRLLDEGWQYKKQLSDQVSTPEIDEIYEAAKSAGAVGGKLMGAGGGGFMVFVVKPEFQERVRERLKHLIYVPFQFESSGSKIVLYQPNGLG
ncbi:MAG: kinase [Candidatus Nitrohelix vancouverensis]|uniref:Kinase n=1 Tax=Candidatus Nitrohelix vancouverensis TaxID=2705534 RepID=A0A7T0C2C4_9BACT|nr:MAG: kinase [Candidatus Nitrohelix vancouverensis]